jgi:hypothetical protein
MLQKSQTNLRPGGLDLQNPSLSGEPIAVIQKTFRTYQAVTEPEVRGSVFPNRWEESDLIGLSPHRGSKLRV